MEASIVDMRYKMKSVLQSLKRNEPVKIYYHNKWIATIAAERTKKSRKKMQEHPFFGMHATEPLSVDEHMEKLRGARSA